MRRIISKLKNSLIGKKLIYYWKFVALWLFVKFSGQIIKYDEKNPKTFPIVIISFNQLFFLKKLIDFLKDSGYLNIVIIDNNSTYIPLLQYFEEIKDNVVVHRLNHNFGHKIFWIEERFYKVYGNGYYVITDADIVPDKDCPSNFLSYFKKVLDSHEELTKVGFSLRINNIPDYNSNKEKIVKWEKKFWKKRDVEGNFIADIDTTFALYRPKNIKAIRNQFYKAIRLKRPYIAEHGGWSINPVDLTPEQKFYMKHAHGSSSWRLDSEGKTIDPKY